MKRNYFIITSVVIGAVFLLTLTGCFEPSKYTGGGWLATCEGGKANFGFVFNGCVDEQDDAFGQFNFHDKGAGVKMKGELNEVVTQNMVIVSYRSTNPKMRGDGYAEVMFFDVSEGTETHGWVQIYVLDGPFKDYFIAGDIQGNIQSHECNDEED